MPFVLHFNLRPMMKSCLYPLLLLCWLIPFGASAQPVSTDRPLASELHASAMVPLVDVVPDEIL
jgi:hypothetical protein